ncbi:MAG: hypothetical protein SPF19_11610 [Oliverpabstia sp.]|nr:hypothetical protein [Oliverpabstia sp.]
MDKLFLRNDLITGNTLTQDGVVAYIALRILIDESIPLYNKASSIDCVSVNRLAYLLVGLVDYEKALMDALARGIAELSGGEWISIHKNLSTNKSYEFVLDLQKIWIDTEKDKFTVVYLNDIYKIMTCNEKMDKKIRMLKYYVVLVSTFDWALDGKIGHMSQDYIAEQADNSTRTCQRYNDIFVDMQMIYVYKSNDKVRDGDKLKQIKNCYSRYEDKDVCERYASGYEEMYGVEHKIVRTKKNKQQADNNRRLAQIYNRICNGYADEYDKATINEVYKYITNRNKLLQEKIDEKNNQSYLSYSDQEWVEKLESQIRDTSIFEQFDFLQNTNNSVSADETGDWGEPDPLIDFSVEEMLDMPTMGEVQSDPTSNVTDSCILQSEGIKSESFGFESALSESFGNSNSDRQKSENPKMDSEQGSQNSSTLDRDDLELIDIDSLFDDESDDKPVLSQDEAWELFS